jgi:hypothetical protein
MRRILAAMSGHATRVWNRACDYHFQPTRVGDRLLKAAIVFDGLANNGGLGYAIDVAEPAEVQEALEGFRRFGLDDAVQVVEAALALDDEGAQEMMNDAYWSAADSFDAMFERYYATHTEEFDPTSLSRSPVG